MSASVDAWLAVRDTVQILGRSPRKISKLGLVKEVGVHLLSRSDNTAHTLGPLSQSKEVVVEVSTGISGFR